jgi:hypothetical protein
MEEAMIKKEVLKDLMNLLYKFILGKTEYGIAGIHESATDSEHVHRFSVFICDREHNPKDLRFIDELKQYLDAHFPEDESPELSVGSLSLHSS